MNGILWPVNQNRFRLLCDIDTDDQLFSLQVIDVEIKEDYNLGAGFTTGIINVNLQLPREGGPELVDLIKQIEQLWLDVLDGEDKVLMQYTFESVTLSSTETHFDYRTSTRVLVKASFRFNNLATKTLTKILPKPKVEQKEKINPLLAAEKTYTTLQSPGVSVTIVG